MGLILCQNGLAINDGWRNGDGDRRHKGNTMATMATAMDDAKAAAMEGTKAT